MKAFLCRKLAVFRKYNAFTQSNNMRAMLQIFWFCFHFLEDKRLLLMKMLVLQTIHLQSIIRNFPYWS